jgi:phage-related protein
MATFPDIQNPSGMTERTMKGQYKNKFGAGYVQSAPKWTRSRKQFNLTWDAMSDADKETLEDFFAANLGSTFDWTHPITGAVYTVRFSDDELPAQYKQFMRWQVDITLEEQ